MRSIAARAIDCSPRAASGSGAGGGSAAAGGGWQRGLDYLRFDGTTDVDERDYMVKHFHAANSRIRLFLISTRAGGLGLSLTAASRVMVDEVIMKR